MLAKSHNAGLWNVPFIFRKKKNLKFLERLSYLECSSYCFQKKYLKSVLPIRVFFLFFAKNIFRKRCILLRTSSLLGRSSYMVGLPPFWGDFGAFWGISDENGVQYWPARVSKLAEKTIHRPSGVISEVLLKVGFALPACLGPKSTLWGTSEMTPDRWCTVFSA